MRRVRIYPYKMGSQGASRLAEALRSRGINTLKVYPDKNYRVNLINDIVINWGNPRQPQWAQHTLLDNLFINNPTQVQIASNKLHTFQALDNRYVNIPDFTTQGTVADRWFNQGQTVVARRNLKGSGGKGIEIYSPEGGILPSSAAAPLYVKYIKKRNEYRVHIFNGSIIDVQEKRKRRNFDGTIDTKIRSHDKGWVFCRENMFFSNDICEEASRAILGLGLGFGAVDVIWNEHYRQATVLEINTAPGLEGETINKYADAIEGVARQ